MDDLYYGVGRTIVDGVIGIAALVALVWGWGRLSSSTAGRALQFVVVGTVYAIWLAAPLIVGYLCLFVFPDEPFAAPQSFSTGLFVAASWIAVSGFLIAQLVIALGYWNAFTRFAQEKVGLDLPKVSWWHGYH